VWWVTLLRSEKTNNSVLMFVDVLRSTTPFLLLLLFFFAGFIGVFTFLFSGDSFVDVDGSSS